MNNGNPDPDPGPRLPQPQAGELADWLVHCHSQVRIPDIYQNAAAQRAMATFLHSRTPLRRPPPHQEVDRHPAIQPSDLQPAVRQLRCWADSSHQLLPKFQTGLPHPETLRSLAQAIEDFLESRRTAPNPQQHRRPA